MTHLTLIKNGKEKRLDLARIPGLSVPYGKLIAWTKWNKTKSGISDELYFWKISPTEVLVLRHYPIGEIYEEFWRKNNAVIIDEELLLEACGNFRIGGPV